MVAGFRSMWLARGWATPTYRSCCVSTFPSWTAVPAWKRFPDASSDPAFSTASVPTPFSFVWYTAQSGIDCRQRQWKRRNREWTWWCQRAGKCGMEMARDPYEAAGRWWREEDSRLRPGEEGGITLFMIPLWDGCRYGGGASPTRRPTPATWPLYKPMQSTGASSIDAAGKHWRI